MSAEHTPTPWEVNGSAIETVSTPSYVIGSVYEGDLVDIDSATADANAAFIVRAANCHDDLVAALKRAMEELRLIRMKDCNVVYDTTLRVVASLALEKAESRS